MMLFLTLLVSIGVQAQNDPLIGTWKLNVAKSKYSPGPPPKSDTTKYEVAGQGIDVTAEVVNVQGVRATIRYTANWDGKDYPITGSQNYDTVSMKRINPAEHLRSTRKQCASQAPKSSSCVAQVGGAVQT
jgi:hypothetical protein